MESIDKIKGTFEKKYHDKGFGKFVVQSSGSFERPKRVKLCGLIAQVVRARA